MSVFFIMSMFFLSFMPLWLCIVFLDIMSLMTDRTYPYTEIIGLSFIIIGLITCIIIIWRVMSNEGGQNYERVSVLASEKDTISTTTFLLSNVLPLLAFDFTKWQSTFLFLIIFGSMALLCKIHHRYDSNILMELLGYHKYIVCCKSGVGTKEGLQILVKEKALNINDKIAIRKIGNELYIGYKIKEW